MSKDPIISLAKIAKKMKVRDHYLGRRLETKADDAYRTWRDPNSFLRWFVPPELSVVSYEHDDEQNKIVLQNNLGDQIGYRLRYNRDEPNFIIQLSGGLYFDDQRESENEASFTVKFDELSELCEELGEDVKVTFVQLLIRHPTLAAWYSADALGLHKLWTGAFERYVARVEAH